jgi:hypothetical protein
VAQHQPQGHRHISGAADLRSRESVNIDLSLQSHFRYGRSCKIGSDQRVLVMLVFLE